MKEGEVLGDFTRGVCDKHCQSHDLTPLRTLDILRAGETRGELSAQVEA